MAQGVWHRLQWRLGRSTVIVHQIDSLDGVAGAFCTRTMYRLDGQDALGRDILQASSRADLESGCTDMQSAKLRRQVHVDERIGRVAAWHAPTSTWQLISSHFAGPIKLYRKGVAYGCRRTVADTSEPHFWPAKRKLHCTMLPVAEVRMLALNMEPT